jgi:asparagine synthase (glutamine-hydrolysing)
MCGISAIAGVTRPGAIESAIKAMVQAIEHRGPDATSSRAAAGCALGHARLSIIDLSTGNQPMSDASGRWSIAVNGEIYNFRDVREELARRGHAFRTHSDTEVVLLGYREWGPALLDRLRGMFAFAIWDAEERELFAARDLLGEKPLYFADAGDGIVLASEMKAIVASKLVPLAADPESIDAFLALGYVPPDRTIYRDVQTLPPAHYLLWKNGTTRITRYWTPQLEPREMSLPDAAEQVRTLLRQAVKRQMLADVPVGAFLSGGLDSSTVVAMMQEHSREPVKTFSVGFGSLINELPYARAVATRYATEHHEIDLGEPDVASLIERMVQVYDEPFADTSHIPTFLVSEFARRHVKVVLSGDGGDELFGGYGWYGPLAMSERVAMPLVQWVVLRSMSIALRHRNRALAARSHAAGLAARWDDVWTRDIMSQTIFRAPERQRMWGGRRVASFEPGGYFRPPEQTTGLNRAFYFDLTSYLPGDILVKVDRAAMAHGLETRAPFLDRDLVEFALTIPATLKVRGRETKLVLREACKQFWPESLWNRPKQGFGSPITRWLKLPAMQPLLDRVFNDGSALRELLPGIGRNERHGLTYRTWTLLTLGLWLDAKGVSL